tara:strand:- start:2173 stop:2859 length:687 start_codon:yes stop_codon:yes gene_type:complete
MKNIKALTLAFLLTFFGSSYALADGFTVGLTGSMAMIDATGTETEGTEATSGEANNSAGIASVFVEYNDIMGSGFSLGVDYIPGAADISSNVKKRSDTETSVTGTADETTTKRINKAQAELENHMTLYATYGNDVYVKVGYARVDLNTLETLGTGSKYGNDTVDGIALGAGAKFDIMDNVEGRVELSHINYDDISISSGTARTGVTTNNKIEADIDVTMFSASVGYKF